LFTQGAQSHHHSEQKPLVTQFTREMFLGRNRPSSPNRDREDHDREYHRQDDRDHDVEIEKESTSNIKQERMDDYAVNSIQNMYHGVTKQESDYYIFDMPGSSGYSGEGSSSNSNVYAERELICCASVLIGFRFQRG